MIAVPWFVLSTTGSAFLTGVVAFSETAPDVVAKALGGPLIDRIGARRVAVTADLASMAAVGAVLALDVPLWLIVAVWAVGGFGQGFLNPIIWAVIFERIPRDLLGRVQSLITALAWAGIPAGPPAAGALLVVVGLSPVLVVFGLVFLIVTTLPGLQRGWAELNRTAGRLAMPVSRGSHRGG